jgi:hypothetical protein
MKFVRDRGINPTKTTGAGFYEEIAKALNIVLGGKFGASPEEMDAARKVGRKELGEFNPEDYKYTTDIKSISDYGKGLPITGTQGTGTDILKDTTSKYLAQLKKDFEVTGKITSAKDYREKVNVVGGMNIALPQAMYALSNGIPEFENTAKRYEEIAFLMVNGTADQVESLNEAVTAYIDMKRKMEAGEEIPYLTAEGKEATRPLTAADLSQAFNMVTSLYQTGLAQTQINMNPIPGSVNLEKTAYTPGMFKLIEERARKIDDLRAAELGAINPIYETKFNIDRGETKLLVEFKEGDIEEIKGATSEGITEAYDKLIKEGKIKDVGDIGISVQKDMSVEQFERAKSLYPALLEKFVGMGYEAKPSTDIFSLEDGQMSMFTADMTIFQILLQEILETEKKQLDGLYNLPDGASFWIPLQAALKRPTGGGGLSDKTIVEPPKPQETPMLWKSSLDEIMKKYSEPGGIGSNPTPTVEELLQDRGVVPPQRNIPPMEDLLKNWGIMPPRETQPPLKPLKNYIAEENENMMQEAWMAKKYDLSGMGDFYRSLQNGFQDLQPGGDRTTITEVPMIETRLTLDNTTNVRLIVDGRTLAEIVSRYLTDNMVQQGNNATAVHTVSV